MSTDLWSKQREKLRIAADGSAELVERWHGPAGASKADRNAWLALYTGWSSVEFDETFVTDTGDAVCAADLVWKVDANGDKIPVGSADYGLIRRSWRLYGTQEQVPVEATDRVLALANRDASWPRVIRATIETMNRVWEQEIKAWDPTSNTSPALTQFDLDDLWTPAGATLEEIAWAKTYAQILLRDEEPLSNATQYVLSKSEEVTSLAAIAVSHLHVGRWLSTATLLGLEPTLTGSVATRIGMTEIESALGPLIWLKQAPEHVDTSGGNVELVQEYHASVRPPAGSLAEQALELTSNGPIL